ncbi:MAG: caspase family protein [Pseudomonadota bacterium]|nr:caspase family protein [Pseudomonadota bacterium]
MKRLAIALLSLGMLCAPLAWAGFGEGLAAYKAFNFATALKEWLPLAKQGDAKAQYNLGNMYNEGLGVRKDATEAVKWYRKAAEQGNAEAQYNLGIMYTNGRGVRQDATEAVDWYRKAAEQGNASAQFGLGLFYAEGEGVRQDAAEAVKWYRMALANPGLDDAFKQATQTLLDGQLAVAPQTRKSVFTDREPPTLHVDHGTTQTITQGDLLIQGSATDSSGIAEVTVDGKAVEFAANGAFSLKRFFPIGETILKITATDIHGNRATQKLTVIRQAAATQIAVDEPELTPPPAKTRQNPNALALIVGVEDYRNAPKARWAARDAAVFYDYAQRSLGIPAGNIKLLTGEQANRTGMLAALKTWLAPMVTPGKSQVYVYFAGHGLASADGRATYLIPQDGDPGLLEDTALDRERLIDEIARVKPLSMTLFLDTCYSGGARGGEGTLVEDTRGIMVKSRAASRFPGLMQFSAASNNQLAHSHPSQQHGLYSYYLMRGLGGEADANRDNKLTAGELQDYVQEKVKRMSMTQGRAQEPELMGDREKVIAIWSK